MLHLLIALCILSTSADPLPTGGASCITFLDCGVNGGFCMPNMTVKGNESKSYCVCNSDRGNPDCSYSRTSRSLAGGLQFLCFAGIGGVGQFVLGNIGHAVGQLILLTLIVYCGICVLCCMACGLLMKGDGPKMACEGFGGVVLGLIACMPTAGLIWCIIEGAYILQGKITDGNGYATY
jgi:hypothetical protein